MAYFHRCYAIGCEKRVTPSKLMCSAHWRMVSYSTRMEVQRTYRPGQEKDKNPSKEWVQAATKARREVKQKEKAT